MINSYIIKDNILYLYLDINDEFFKKNKSKNIEDNINKFIIENKIDYKGNIVLLVLGGVIIGQVLLNNNISSKKVIKDYTATQEISKNIENENIENNTENILEQEILKDEKDVENNSIKKDEIKSSNEVKISSTSVQSNKKNTTMNNSTKSTKTNTSSNTSSFSKKSSESKDNNDLIVSVYRNSGEVLKVEFEKYIFGVLAAEMPAAFQNDALMAQAIIIRTYTLKALENGKKLTDNEQTQSYKTDSELKKIWGSNYTTYYNKLKKVVEKTKGMSLTYQGKYIEAVYHSTSNGMTEDSVNVWGNKYPYLVSVKSDGDSVNPSFQKNSTISYQQLSLKLKQEITDETNFEIISKTKSNRVYEIKVGDKVYKGTEFRNLLGLRSCDFTIEKQDDGIIFTTKGYGHGVGLSQYGANGMAKKGYNYEEILKHYYQGVSISKK